MTENHINEQIRKYHIRIVNPGNPPINTTYNEALKLARNSGEDLIQIGYDAVTDSAICQIMEYGKYKYLQQKKQKPASTPELKEFKFGLNISEHDIDTKLNHATELLKKKHPIKVTVFLKNWQKDQMRQAKELFQNIKDKMGSIAIEQSYKETDRQIIGTFVLNNKKV